MVWDKCSCYYVRYKSPTYSQPTPRSTRILPAVYSQPTPRSTHIQPAVYSHYRNWRPANLMSSFSRVMCSSRLNLQQCSPLSIPPPWN